MNETDKQIFKELVRISKAIKEESKTGKLVPIYEDSDLDEVWVEHSRQLSGEGLAFIDAVESMTDDGNNLDDVFITLSNWLKEK